MVNPQGAFLEKIKLPEPAHGVKRKFSQNDHPGAGFYPALIS
jgi:hypothetical protein